MSPNTVGHVGIELLDNAWTIKEKESNMLDSSLGDRAGGNVFEPVTQQVDRTLGLPNDKTIF